jgi:hypothetical protein
VFSAWFLPRGYKGTKKAIWVSCCQEMGRVLEMAVEVSEKWPERN